MEKLVVNLIGDLHFSSSTPSSRKDDYPSSIVEKYVKVTELYPADVNILLGDVFHKSVNSLEFVNTMALIEQRTKEVHPHETWVIPGNHDVFSDLSYLKRSSLFNWIATGLVKQLVFESVQVGKYKINFIACDYNAEPVKCDKQKNVINILIAHMFFEFSEVSHQDFTLTRDMIVDNNYDYVVLGHDHAKYTPVQVGNAIVFRPGSLSRCTSAKSNVNREVSILQMVFEDKEGLKISYDYKHVPSLPIEQVFKESSRDGKKASFKKDMEAFVKAVMASEFKALSVYDVLDSMDTDQYIKTYIENILVSHGIMRKM